MVLTKRERYIFIATAALVGVLGLNYVAVTPLLAQREELGNKIESAQRQASTDRLLLERSSQMSRKWSDIAKGPLKRDASEAESQVLHSVRDWAQDAGMSLSSLKPDRTEREKDFYRVTLRATGTGGMAQIGNFLYRIQTATIPVKVVDLQISTRKEGADDLSIQLGISTIYFAPDEKKSAAGATAVSREVTQ